MGYESIYESDLLLFLSKGVLVGQITIDNKKTIETNLKSFNDAKEKFKLAIADDQKLRENIDRKISRMKEIIAFDAAASTLADGCGGKNTDNPTDSYDQVLGSYLKKYWNTPYKEELGGKKPEVTVLINISADGRIASYRILKSSNNRPMDDSVERLFSSLKRVPQPPDRVAREFKLIMEIGEED
jgi:TonB family protein